MINRGIQKHIILNNNADYVRDMTSSSILVPKIFDQGKNQNDPRPDFFLLIIMQALVS